MADESQTLHDLLMTGIHKAMAEFCDIGMDETEAVQAMMAGLAGTVAETMATLALSFQPDNPGGASAFYTTFRDIVGRMMHEPEEAPQTLIPPPRQIMVEPRGPDEPVIFRTVH